MIKFVQIKLLRKFSKEVFKLPDLGEKIKEGEVKKLFVKIGSHVREFDPIAEVATDKATAEITSPFNGVITQLFTKENESCNVGSPFFEIETDKEVIPLNSPVITENIISEPLIKDLSKLHSTKEDEESVKAAMRKQSNILERLRQSMSNSTETENSSDLRSTLNKTDTISSPAVRVLAKKSGIDISKVKASGKGGRVLKEDIIDYLSQMDELVRQYEHKTLSSTAANNVIGVQNQKIQNQNFPLKMTSFEKGMVKSMTYAATVPHFHLCEEFNIESLAEMREGLKERGVSISLFALVTKAFSLALSDFPKINSTYSPEVDQFTYFLNASHNVSIAIDSENGLVAPNIKDVQKLSAVEIDKEIKKLRELANQGKLTGSYLEGGTVALSNVGTIAGHYASPLNIPGQTCIVALGKVMIRPSWNEKSQTFLPKRHLPVSFGCDHRVLDGATVARFSLHWKNYIENPFLLLAMLK